MATITGAQNERVFQIKQWLGLNESPDGDTKLRLGEAAVMQNFRVTRDGNLQKRPGLKRLWTPDPGMPTALRGAWSGEVAGKMRVIAVLDDEVYSLLDNNGDWQNERLGSIERPSGGIASDRLLFGFQGKLYIVGYTKLYVYDGAGFAAAEPYVPLVEVGLTPLGDGTLLEQVNKLTGKRRVWLSPDGRAASFQLPEAPLVSIDYAKNTATGAAVGFTANAQTGTISFSAAPAQGVSSIEVGYTAVSQQGLPPEIARATNAELYNGDQLNRVFLYGGGGNQAVYSGVNYSGEPDASYFPDLNVVSAGDSGERITNLIRYNSRLLCFTENAAYTIQYGQMTLPDGALTAAFYVTPVHKTLGCDVPGSAQLVMNSPVVLHRGDLYAWVGSDSGNMSADERQAKRISDRVHKTLGGMGGGLCCFDDNRSQEYYVSRPGTGETLVWNYAADAWYCYTGVRMAYAFSLGGALCFFQRGMSLPGGPKTAVFTLDEATPCDETGSGGRQAIDCRWESGSMSFEADYRRKYSAMLWVGIRPARHGEVLVTVKTDRSGSLTEKLVGHSWASFAGASFAAWSFNTSRRPNLRRLKIKAKKFVYYKLIFRTNTDDSTATVTAADIRVRYTGYSK